MADTGDAGTIDPLLGELRWTRRLAGALVRDAQEAADLAQDTWEAALRIDREEGPTPEQALARLEQQRLAADLVAGLEEPYRQTVVLRYFEDLSSAEIARRIGAPEGTVRWRLKAGLDRLRGRLDERHGGDRRAWAVLLAPLGRRRPPRWWPPR